MCDKKVFQSKVNCPLGDRCMGYIVNMFEKVSGGPYALWLAITDILHVEMSPCEQTHRTENNPFPFYPAGGDKDNWILWKVFIYANEFDRID